MTNSWFYTAGSAGIARWDLNCGKLAFRERFGGFNRASFVCNSPGSRYLYVVYDDPDDSGRTGRIDGLSSVEGHSIASLRTGAATPCYVSAHPSGRQVYVANFRDHGRPGGRGAGSRGSFCSFRVGDDGSLTLSGEFRHEGASIHPQRQTNSHPHSVRSHPNGRFVVVADLGIDRVLAYPADPVTGELVGEPSSVAFVPGSGPRHLVFHRNGRYLFVINEIGNSVSALAFDPETGRMRESSTVTVAETGACADVHVHPDGAHVFASVRGADQMVMLRFSQAGGSLRFVGRIDTGTNPRGFAVSPTGEYLLVASGGTLVSYRFCDGVLMKVDEAEAPEVMCLAFASASSLLAGEVGHS